MSLSFLSSQISIRNSKIRNARPDLNRLIAAGGNFNALDQRARNNLINSLSPGELSKYIKEQPAATPAPTPAPTPAATPAATPAPTPAPTPAATNNNGSSAADLMRMYQEGLGAGRSQTPRARTTAEELALERGRASLANSTRTLESQARQRELALQNQGQLSLAQLQARTQEGTHVRDLAARNASESRAVEARLRELNLQNNHSLVANREQAQREAATQLRNQEFRERDQRFQNRSQLELMREGNTLDLARKTREQELQMEGQRVSLAQTQQARAKERETEAQLQRRQQSTERGNAMAAYRGL